MMKPLYFQGRFGWLHTDVPQAASGVGVVICPAFAQEEICTRHGWMALADQLARAGHAVLRFDYLSTGHSADGDLSVAGMVEDVLIASRTIASLTGIRFTVLMGVRLGAAVALMAADKVQGLAGIVLLAPVLSGAAFMRETRMAATISSLSRLDPVPAAGSDQVLNTNGFKWSPAFQSEVSKIDMRAAAAPGVPSLLMAVRGDRLSVKVSEAWCAAGDAASNVPFHDYMDWMQDPTTHSNPTDSFARIVDWVRSLPLTDSLARTTPEYDVSCALTGKGFVEEPIRFGANNAVFGILCRPSGVVTNEVAALMIHEGSSHAIGDGRAYVVLARELARAGYVSLRFDLTGMGDSPAHGNSRNPHYDPERIAECVAGLDVLEQAGCGKAVTLGLCSGAYMAQETALVDERVVGGVLINPQKIVWHYGDDIRIVIRDSKRSLKAYLRAMRNPGEWRRLLFGKVDFKGILRVLGKRGLIRARRAVTNLLPPAEGSERKQAHEKLRRLSQRGVLMTLLMSDEDPGLDEVKMQLGLKGKLLADYPPLRLIVLDRADHHFNGTHARQRHTSVVLDVMARAAAREKSAA